MSRIIGYTVLGTLSLAIIVALGFGAYGLYIVVAVVGRGLNPI